MDYLYAAFYHITKHLFGKAGGWSYANKVSTFIFGILVMVPIPLIIYLFKLPPNPLFIILGFLLYVILIVFYDKREKVLLDENEDERYLRFLRQNLWIRLPFIMIVILVLLFTLAAISLIAYGLITGE